MDKLFTNSFPQKRSYLLLFALWAQSTFGDSRDLSDLPRSSWPFNTRLSLVLSLRTQAKRLNSRFTELCKFSPSSSANLLIVLCLEMNSGTSKISLCILRVIRILENMCQIPNTSHALHKSQHQKAKY